jgi:hypothetical protein
MGRWRSHCAGKLRIAPAPWFRHSPEGMSPASGCGDVVLAVLRYSAEDETTSVFAEFLSAGATPSA